MNILQYRRIGDIETETEENNQNQNRQAEVYIYIMGEVKNPGVYKLNEGARVIDAIENAGGATEMADLGRVNLAFLLSDGQQINIPNVNNKDENFQSITQGNPENVIIGVANNNTKTKVNINTATQAELETLTGVGPSLAVKILDYREKHGKFKKIEDIKNVSGIGNAKFESIKDEIIVK